MMAKGRPALFGAMACFSVFLANVVTGAMGAPVFLGDVSEMLTLFAAVLLFVAGVLAREAQEPSGSEPLEKDTSLPE